MVTERPDRDTLLRIIRSLMLVENLGDVHDEINRLCDLAGTHKPEGDFLDGWTDEDWHSVGTI